MPKKAIVTIVDAEADTDTYLVEFDGEFMPHRMFNENWVTFDHVTSIERLMVLPDKETTE